MWFEQNSISVAVSDSGRKPVLCIQEKWGKYFSLIATVVSPPWLKACLIIVNVCSWLLIIIVILGCKISSHEYRKFPNTFFHNPFPIYNSFKVHHYAQNVTY